VCPAMSNSSSQGSWCALLWARECGRLRGGGGGGRWEGGRVMRVRGDYEYVAAAAVTKGAGVPYFGLVSAQVG
jgi:hypothetical protein